MELETHGSIFIKECYTLIDVNVNEKYYALGDIEDCQQFVDEASVGDIPAVYADIIIDALEFYKEMQYTNG